MVSCGDVEMYIFGFKSAFEMFVIVWQGVLLWCENKWF